jgi:nicotinamide mononucleotide adenylyltransferase
MDPTHAPDFRPPSTNPPVEPTLPPTLIPNRRPIQPPVLADYLNPLDKPIEPSSTAKHRSSSFKHKIPKQPTELEPFSSSDESEESNNIYKEIPIPINEIIIPTTIDNTIDKIDNIDNIDNIDITNTTNTATTATTTDTMPIKLPGITSVNNNDNKPIHKFLSEKGPKVHSYQIADLEEVPHGIQRQSKTLSDYNFPTHRLKTQMTSSNKFPLVVVACGSFSPITYLHLRIFEMALDSVREQTRFEVIGAYFSPVSDNYRKPGLASAYHRVRMCELACERTSSWLMVDAWESLQPKYTRTALVLDHFNEEINIKRNGVLSKNGDSNLGVKIMLLAGGDLIESMGEPNVWAEQDLHHILGNYGCLIVERTGSDVRSFLLSHDIMYEHRKNILVIKQLIYNDISSTKVRLFLRRNMSVQYLLPNSVIRYIQEHGLYVDEKEPVKLVLNK